MVRETEGKKATKKSLVDRQQPDEAARAREEEAHNNVTRAGDKGAAKRMAPSLGIPYPVIKKSAQMNFSFLCFATGMWEAEASFFSIEIIPNQ